MLHHSSLSRTRADPMRDGPIPRAHAHPRIAPANPLTRPRALGTSRSRRSDTVTLRHLFTLLALACSLVMATAAGAFGPSAVPSAVALASPLPVLPHAWSSGHSRPAGQSAYLLAAALVPQRAAAQTMARTAAKPVYTRV